MDGFMTLIPTFPDLIFYLFNLCLIGSLFLGAYGITSFLVKAFCEPCQLKPILINGGLHGKTETRTKEGKKQV